MLKIDRLDLGSGLYYVDVGAYAPGMAAVHDYHWNVYPLTVGADSSQKGILHIPHRWENDASTGEASHFTRQTPAAAGDRRS